MAGDLLDALVAKPQRETAGSDTSLRFDYQKNWAFCEMLRRHMLGADYLVAFEFHDDVVFLTPSERPTDADFYQVKTAKSAAPKKLAAITARAKEANSILGKLFSNFTGIAASHKVRVILVSNVAFEFADRDVCAKDLAEKPRKKIIEKLKAELVDFSEDRIDDLHFLITGVSIDAMQSYLHGEAMELFKATFGEGHGFNVHSWVRLLQSEIARKNNYSSEKITQLRDLISHKCIGRNAVEQSLTLVKAQRHVAPDMAIVNAELKSKGWSNTDLIRLGKRMPDAASDCTDALNKEAADIMGRLEELYDASSNNHDLGNFVSETEGKILASLTFPYRDRIYLAAMSIMVFYEKI